MFVKCEHLDEFINLWNPINKSINALLIKIRRTTKEAQLTQNNPKLYLNFYIG